MHKILDENIYKIQKSFIDIPYPMFEVRDIVINAIYRYEDDKEWNSCREFFLTMLKLWLYQFFIDP